MRPEFVPMLRLRKQIRLSPDIRDRLGIVCAVGAAACLASFTLHWSRQLPLETSPWERDLFGDLSTEPATPTQPVSGTRQTAEHAEAARNQPILVEVMPNPMSQMLATPIDVLPETSADIQPVLHQQSVSSPSVWLSGAIEAVADQLSPASEESPARYFPRARFK